MGDTTPQTGGADWSTWLQDIGKKWASAAISAEYQQPYDIQRLRLQALGQAGLYEEGQPIGNRQGVALSSGTLLLIGGAVLVYVLMKD